MILVALKDIETWQHEFILLLDELVQQLDVVRITEMVPRQAIHIVQQLILLPRQRRLRTLDVSAELLGQSAKLVCQLLLIDGSGQVAVDHFENFYIFL